MVQKTRIREEKYANNVTYFYPEVRHLKFFWYAIFPQKPWYKTYQEALDALDLHRKLASSKMFHEEIRRNAYERVMVRYADIRTKEYYPQIHMNGVWRPFYYADRQRHFASLEDAHDFLDYNQRGEVVSKKFHNWN